MVHLQGVLTDYGEQLQVNLFLFQQGFNIHDVFAVNQAPDTQLLAGVLLVHLLTV